MFAYEVWLIKNLWLCLILRNLRPALPFLFFFFLFFYSFITSEVVYFFSSLLFTNTWLHERIIHDSLNISVEVLLKLDATLGPSCSPASLGNLKSTQTCIYLELCCTSDWNKKKSGGKTMRKSDVAWHLYGLWIWKLRFVRPWTCRTCSSGTWRRGVWWIDTNISGGLFVFTDSHKSLGNFRKLCHLQRWLKFKLCYVSSILIMLIM